MLKATELLQKLALLAKVYIEASNVYLNTASTKSNIAVVGAQIPITERALDTRSHGHGGYL